MTDREYFDLLDFLEATPEAVRQLTISLSESDLRWKPRDDEFSALEQVCHLRDIEREGYGPRIKKLLTEEKPLLPDLDGSRLARERDYNSQQLAAALNEFTRARLDDVAILRQVTPDQLLLSGVLEGVGDVTLGNLLHLMRQHDESHRRELAELHARASEASAGSSTSDLSEL